MGRSSHRAGRLSIKPAMTGFSWKKRLLLGIIAFAGTGAYAASFTLVGSDEGMIRTATAVGIAAGVSWVGFGLALLAVTRCRPSVMAWADACLVTMSVGIAVLSVSTALNGLGLTIPSRGHAAILVIANVLMGIAFVRQAVSLGMGSWMAAALWIGILDVLFALIFPVLR